MLLLIVTQQEVDELLANHVCPRLEEPVPCMQEISGRRSGASGRNNFLRCRKPRLQLDFLNVDRITLHCTGDGHLVSDVILHFGRV